MISGAAQSHQTFKVDGEDLGVPGSRYLGRELLRADVTEAVDSQGVTAYVDSVLKVVGEEGRLTKLRRDRRSTGGYPTTEARNLREYLSENVRLSEKEGLRPVSPTGRVNRQTLRKVSPKVYSARMGKERTSSSVDFGIRIGAVVARDRSLLLVRHQKPGRDPYWVLPGGRLEPGETILECAEREVSEETGLSARFSGLLYLSEFLREERHTVDVTVRMILEGDSEAVLGSDPEVAPGSEPTIKELRWVGADELREIELFPAPIKARLLEDVPGGWPPSTIYLGRSGN